MRAPDTASFNSSTSGSTAPKKGKKTFLRSEIVAWSADEVVKRRRELIEATIIDDMNFRDSHIPELNARGRPNSARGKDFPPPTNENW